MTRLPSAVGRLGNAKITIRVEGCADTILEPDGLLYLVCRPDDLISVRAEGCFTDSYDLQPWCSDREVVQVGAAMISHDGTTAILADDCWEKP